MSAPVVDNAIQLNRWSENLRHRLDVAARESAQPDTGDHILNPDLPPYARWQGPPRDAAVLIGIVERDTGLSVVLTQRTGHLKAHAGQVAFPGGKIDPTDAGPVDAALREADEEIGLAPSKVETLGTLAPYLTGSGYKIIPVIGKLQTADWEGKRRYFYAMPFGERYIWGVTAGIIRSFYETVYR